MLRAHRVCPVALYVRVVKVGIKGCRAILRLYHRLAPGGDGTSGSDFP
jgi:hypothetical protein